MNTRLLLFDDRRARRWAPFSLTRPIGELPFGCMSLRERAERLFGLSCSGHVTRAALAGFDEPGSAPALGVDALRSDTATVLVSSRAVAARAPDLDVAATTRLTIDGETVGWVVPAGGAAPSDLWLRDPSSAPAGAPAEELGGLLLAYPWSLVVANPSRVVADFQHLWGVGSDTPGAIRVGDGHVSLGAGATVEPGVVLDTRAGPIRLSDGVSVEGPSRLVGPLFVGPGSVILGGHVGSSTIGERCKVRGEVSESVISSFVNKAHEGHLGHALLGRWVNLGAGTHNSDLKNNYRPVRVWTPEGDVDTGLVKMGCLLGDHVRTGIGTLLNTGSVVGAGSNVFGGRMPPVAVPPFSWGDADALGTHRLDAFLRSAEHAMARRDSALTPGLRDVLSRAWKLTESQRATPPA